VADLDAVGPGEKSVTVGMGLCSLAGVELSSPDVVVVVAVVPRVGVGTHAGWLVGGR
jgi:hypothetical protein